MRVEVVSESKQIFSGQSYWVCGYYFQCRGKRLHRVVWEYHNGPIPKGFHVHHKDNNRSNNQIENLELLHKSIHMSQHMEERLSTTEGMAAARQAMDEARVYASKWHKSPEGRVWHSEIKKGKKLALKHKRTCKYCNQIFDTALETAMYCSNNCYSKNYRKTHPEYYSKQQRAARLQSKSTEG